MVVLLITGCGCLAPYPAPDNTGAAQPAEKIDAGREYSDNLVLTDPGNATAWTVRGMYYNNAVGRYGEALESDNRSPGLDPVYGLAWYAVRRRGRPAQPAAVQ